MSDFLSEQFLQNCENGKTKTNNEKIIKNKKNEGNVDEAKRAFTQNNVPIDYQDKDGNNGLHHAATNGRIEILRLLVQNGINLENVNNEGKSALHLACERGDKECILFLTISGVNPNIKSSSGQKAGDGNMEAKNILNNVVCEEKAFNVLNQQQRDKLIEIFNDVDARPSGFLEGNYVPGQIDLEKSKRFNKYIDESVNDNIAEKDAKDFIKSCSICNKESVNLDEWMFAFSKLFAVDQPAFEKFIEDYDNAVSKKGKLKNQP